MGRRQKRLRKKYASALKSFGEFLEKYPYLGMRHKLGKEIFNSISNFSKVTIENELWWRARKADGAKRFTHKDLMPPKHSNKEGRFNHFGQSCFYLASTKEAAQIEALEKREHLSWIQQFKILKINSILDLSRIGCSSDDAPKLSWFLNIKFRTATQSRSNIWKPQYFIPRFVADCARAQDFSGILFEGTRHKERNLVLFDWVEKIKPVGKPKVVQFRKKRKRRTTGVLDLNSIDLDFFDTIDFGSAT